MAITRVSHNLLIYKDGQEHQKIYRSQMFDDEISINDYQAKLVFCMKNKKTLNEQIFSLELNSHSQQFPTIYHGDAKNIFHNPNPHISKIRNMELHKFQDILISFKTKNDKSSSGKNQTKNDSSNLHSDKMKKLKSSNNLGVNTHYKTFKKKLFNTNYSVLAFVNLISAPYLKVNHKIKSKQPENSDFFVRVTNVESMKSFYVKFSMHNKCLFQQSQELYFNPRFQSLMKSPENSSTLDKENLDKYKNYFEGKSTFLFATLKYV